MRDSKKTNGYSLIEALVAISILLIAVVGPMTIASQGIKSAAFSLEQNTAFFLAQEGVEAMFALRNDYGLQDVFDSPPGSEAWDWVADELNTGPCTNAADQLAGAGDSCSFGVDFRGNDGSLTFTTGATRCHDEATNNHCLLYLDTGSAPGAYTHDSSAGAATQYTRIVTVEYLSDHSVELQVQVFWNSRLYGGAERSVTLTTTLFDLILPGV